VSLHTCKQTVTQNDLLQNDVSYCQTDMADEARLVSSCLILPSRASPRLSRLLDNRGVR